MYQRDKSASELGVGDIAKWPMPSSQPISDFSGLLVYATAALRNHLNWFHRHKESGLKLLGLLIAAELAIAGLHISGGMSAWLTGPPLVLLTILAPLLAHIGDLNCRSCFKAFLEHALLINKIMWAMGFTNEVPVSEALDLAKCPAPHDETLFVPRYFIEATADEARTTKKFVRHHMGRYDTTYWWARLTLWLLGSVGFVGGIVCFVAVVAL